jgi:hypothetical protein
MVTTQNVTRGLKLVYSGFQMVAVAAVMIVLLFRPSLIVEPPFGFVAGFLCAEFMNDLKKFFAEDMGSSSTRRESLATSTLAT